jgi:putative ABC transport system permease protein
MPLRLAGRLRRLLLPFAGSARDRDMDQEMAFHLESITREYVQAGLSEAEAERRARERFGSVLRLKERGHDIRRAAVIEDLVRDFRLAVRGLRRSPGFTFAVVLTFALGIGANTAIFSLIDQVLLRPLPYPDGEKLVAVYDSSRSRFSVSPANWLDWQRESRTMQSLAAWMSIRPTLTGVGETERLNGQAVSAEFFPVLGVAPLLGRAISPEDDRPMAPPVVVLSHALWQRRFGGDPAVIGRIIQLNETATTVIGVMPPGFQFLDLNTDHWQAFRLPRDVEWRRMSGRFMNVVGRIKSGVPLADARREMTSIAQSLAAAHVFNRNTTTTLVPLREELTGRVQRSLVVLYAAVGVLLSIACFNVASLLVTRSVGRRREMAIRASLGAGRLPIIRQLLVESVLLAVVGGAMGVALARLTVQALVAVAPAEILKVHDVQIDRRVLLYALALSVLTGLIAGLAPAVSVARRSLAAHLRGVSAAAVSMARVRQVLVATQMAMTVVLLCGAGLLLRTFLALNDVDTGFDRRQVLTMEASVPTTRYDDERRTAFFARAMERIRALPGVEAVGAGNSAPVVGMPRGGTGFHRLGTPVPPESEWPSTMVRVVTPGYFGALRIPVRRGREFTDFDQASSAAPGFIVNEAFMRAFLSGTDPLAASLSVRMQRPENPYRSIIGVVGDVPDGALRNDARPTVFYSHRQLSEPTMTLFVRTAQPGALSTRVIQEVHALDANVAITDVRTLETVLAESLARERLNAIVSVAFAASGLLLACLGLYGLIAYLVTERTREIGIRIVLGAQLGSLTRSIVWRGLSLVAMGGLIGAASALAVSRSLGALLFGVTPYDVGTYAAVLGLLCLVAGWASYMPARRAARVQPLVALRQE